MQSDLYTLARTGISLKWSHETDLEKVMEACAVFHCATCIVMFNKWKLLIKNKILIYVQALAKNLNLPPFTVLSTNNNYSKLLLSSLAKLEAYENKKKFKKTKTNCVETYTFVTIGLLNTNTDCKQVRFAEKNEALFYFHSCFHKVVLKDS